MLEEKTTTQHKVYVANEVLQAVEKYTVEDGKDFRYVMDEFVNYSYGYASQCFKLVSGMTLSKYVNRRILTQTYRKHIARFDSYRCDETVDGVKNFKRRLKREFGYPIQLLQERITDEEMEDQIWHGEFRRSCKKEIGKWEESRTDFNVEDDKILLVKDGVIEECEWETKVIKHNDMFCVLRGEILKKTGVPDPLFSSYTNGRVAYEMLNIECPVSMVLQYIADYHDGNVEKIPLAFNIQIKAQSKDGTWICANLIDEMCFTLDYKISKINLSKRWLKWEGNDLYLCLDEVETD